MMEITQIGVSMKKIIVSLTLASSLMLANNININNLKWTNDFETLVNLSSSAENTIKGIDQNKNGIRDDVEYYVNNKYQNKPFQKAIYLKAAKTIQTIITLPVNDISQHQKLDSTLLNLYTCNDYILYKMDAESLDTELKNKVIFKAKVLNTDKRLRAYIEHKELLPFKFNELTDAQLEKDKNHCVNQYNKYNNLDKNLISSTK